MSLLARDSLRIVQVEDHEEFSDITGKFLRYRGFAAPIEKFNSGKKAVDYLSKIDLINAPDVILLDLNMPGINGLKVLRWLRNDYCDPKVPVIFLTSSDSTEDQKQAMELGATKYLQKVELYKRLVDDLDVEIALCNHRKLEEITHLPELMAELALQGELADEMIILTDSEGRVEWFNAPFRQACGYALEELRGKKPGAILQGPKSDPLAVDQLHEAVHAVKECVCEIVNYRKNGEAYLVHIELGPVFEHGRHEGFLAVEHGLSMEKAAKG